MDRTLIFFTVAQVPLISTSSPTWIGRSKSKIIPEIKKDTIRIYRDHHEEINIDDNNDWINEDELNESTHIFRCVYNLNKLINQIKNEQNN